MAMEFQKQPECKTKFVKPYNVLVAYDTDLTDEEWNSELQRLSKAMVKVHIQPLSGFVSALCVAESGYWFLKEFEENDRWWYRVDDAETGEDRLARLVCHVSNMAYKAHAERQGRDPSQALESGIGWLTSQMKLCRVPLTENESE